MTATDPTHPIGDDLLIGYATGRLPAAYDLLVACAVSLDDGARVRLAGFEALGGALLARVEVARLRDDSMETVLNRIRRAGPDETVPAAAKAPRRDPVLPRPLRAALGGDADAVRWSGRDGLRIAHATDDVAGFARLVELPQGQALPEAYAPEAMLVLRGSCYLGTLRLRRGDMFGPGTVSEMPVADVGRPCLALLVTDAPMPARTWLPRFTQRMRVL